MQLPDPLPAGTSLTIVIRGEGFGAEILAAKPIIEEWAPGHFEFSGYAYWVTGHDGWVPSQHMPDFWEN